MENSSVRIKCSSELRRAAREKLSGNWGMAVLLCFIFGIITSLPGFIPILGYIISILISGPLALGLIICFIRLVRGESFQIENLFDGFKNFGTAIVLQILMGLFISLWTLLLIIPGIIAAYRYSMAFYILNDNPQLGAMGSLKASKEMMAGYKWKLFRLHFSFIGWALLGIITLGIGYLWLVPYMKTSEAEFYQNLKAERIIAPTSPYEEGSIYREIKSE